MRIESVAIGGAPTTIRRCRVRPAASACPGSPFAMNPGMACGAAVRAIALPGARIRP